MLGTVIVEGEEGHAGLDASRSKSLNQAMNTVSEVPVGPSEIWTLAKALIVEGLVGDLVQSGGLVDTDKRQVVGVVFNDPLKALLNGQIADQRSPVNFAELRHGGMLLGKGGRERKTTWNCVSRIRLKYIDLAEAVL